MPEAGLIVGSIPTASTILKGKTLARYRIVSVDVTKKHYGVGPSMKAMIGKIIHLNSSGKTSGYFSYGGYSWRYEDTEQLKPPKAHEPVLFDPVNLTGE